MSLNEVRRAKNSTM